MAHYRTLRHVQTNSTVLARLKWCASFWCKLRGLMFRRNLPEDEGLVFVYGRESRIDASIHMFFMAFNIAVIWLDAKGRVVDKTLAKVWRPAYAPRSPAQYVIEAHPSLLDRIAIGDELRFE